MESKPSSVSRRRILKSAGVAAAGSAAAVLLGDSSLSAQQGGPAVLTNTQAGRKIRAFVKLDKVDPPSVQQLTLRALTGRQVAIRAEAAQTCYSSVGQVLLPSAEAPKQATIIGHGGVGIVEAVGPDVFAIQKGDRVIVSFHSSCGWCNNCVNARADQCLNLNAEAVPTGDLANGTPVFSGISGMTELMIVNEEKAVPVFTQVPAAELAMLHCVGNTGLAMTMTKAPVEPGSDVVIFGAGPVGLSAVQGARIKGATRMIVVEPIPYRRELAMKLGATATVDPNQFRQRVPNPAWTGTGIAGDRFRDALVDHLREITKPKTDRNFAGGGRTGPDHIIEAVGGDYGGVKPSEVTGPDPTGVTVLHQIWELCSQIGSVVTCSIGHPNGSLVQIPAPQWADGAKHHWGGTGGGVNTRRDVPRYVKMIESGQINMKALAAKTYPLDATTEAYRVAMNRTVVATIVLPNT
jgi:S-(hydroxymethyl)glutathione dehydrogenase/alcohol dehydrogenase